MKLDANARTCPHSRGLAVKRVLEQGWTLAAAAEAAGVSVRTLSKWLRRHREEGEQGLLDRSSAPRAVPGRTSEERIVVIAALRRLRLTGLEIAEALSMPPSTVSAVLTRTGLGKLSRLEPPEPPNRYERRRPGELVHIDVKKLGRIKDGAGKRFLGDGIRRTHNYQRRTDAAGVRRLTVGWEYGHVCVDDATRLAYVEVLADEKAAAAARRVRELVGSDGELIVAVFYEVMVDPAARLADRMEAARWLADRGLGKTPPVIEPDAVESTKGVVGRKRSPERLIEILQAAAEMGWMPAPLKA